MAFRTHCEELESSGAYSGNAEVMPDDRCHDGAEYLSGVQHLLVWKRRDTHLECDAGDATENFIHIKDLLRDRFSIADQQCASGSALGVELSARGGRPATFLSNFRKGGRIARIEYFLGLFRGVREKANGVKTYSKWLGGMTSPAPRFAVEVYKWAEAPWLTADYGHHKRKSKDTCANEGLGRAADTDPYRQRIL